MNSNSTAAGSDGLQKRASGVDLARFREMVGRQTEELNSAIQQRSDYESRLGKAERELKDATILNAQLQRDLALKSDEVTNLTKELEAARLVPLQNRDENNTIAANLAVDALLLTEESCRRHTMAEYWSILCCAICGPFTQLCVEREKEVSLRESRLQIAQLTFQLRVATPIRIRNLFAQAAKLGALNESSQRYIDALHTRIEELLVDCSELRDKNVELAQKLIDSTEDFELTLKHAQDQLSSRDDVARSEVDRMASETEELKMQLESSAAEADMLAMENGRLRAQLADAMHQIEVKDSELQSFVAARDDEVSIRVAETTVKHAEALATYREQLEKITGACKALELEKKLLSTRQQSLEEELDLRNRNIEDLQAAKLALSSQLEDERQQKEETYDTAHSAWERQAAAMQTEIRSLRASVGAADMAHSVAQQKLIQSAGEAQQLRVELSSAREELEIVRKWLTHHQPTSGVTSDSASTFVAVVEEQLARKDAELADAATQLKLSESSVTKAEAEKDATLRELMAQHAAAVNALEIELLRERQTTAALQRCVVDCEACREALKTAEAQLSDERKRSRELLTDGVSKERAVESLNVIVRRLESSLAVVTEERDGLEKKVDFLVARARDVESERATRHSSEMQKLLDSELNLRRQKAVLDADVQRLTDDVRTATSLGDAARERCAVLVTSTEALADELEKSYANNEDLQQMVRKLTRDLHALQLESEELRHTSDASKSVISLSQDAKASLTTELLKLRDECASAKKQIAVLSQELQEKTLSLSATSDDLYAAEHKAQKLADELTLMQRSEKIQRDRAEALFTENDAVRQIMDESLVAVEAEVRALQLEVNALKHDKERAIAQLSTRDEEITRLVNVITIAEASKRDSDDVWAERYRCVEEQCAALRHQLSARDEQIAHMTQDRLSEMQCRSEQTIDSILEHQKQLDRERMNVAERDRRIAELEMQLVTSQGSAARDAAQCETLRVSIHELEHASLEVIAEKDAIVVAAKEETASIEVKLRDVAEQVARWALRCEAIESENASLKANIETLQRQLEESHANAKETVRHLVDTHSKNLLEMESLMDAMSTQEFAEKKKLQAELADTRAALASRQTEYVSETEVVSELRASLERSNARVATLQSELSQSDAAWGVKLQEAYDKARHSEMALLLKKEDADRAKDALALELASHQAEEEAIRQEAERARLNWESKMEQLSHAHREELLLKDSVNKKLIAAKDAELRALSDTVASVTKQLHSAQQQHQELFDKLVASEGKCEESSQMLGSALVEQQRLRVALQHKEEDLQATFTQAAQATDAAHLANSERQASESRCVELSKALIAAQQELEVVQRSAHSTRNSVKSIEESIEQQCQEKLRLQAKALHHTLLAQHTSLMGSVEELESSGRHLILQLYDDIHVVGSLRVMMQSMIRYVAACDARLVEYKAASEQSSLSLRQARHAAAGITKSLMLQLEHSHERQSILSSQYLLERGVLLRFMASEERHIVQLDRDVRSETAQNQLNAAAVVNFKRQLDAERARVRELSSSLDEEKRNRDNFASLSHDSAAQAAESQTKLRDMQTAMHHQRLAAEEALRFAYAVVVEAEADYRSTMEQTALESHNRMAAMLTKVIIDVSRERVEVHRTKDRADALMKLEVDQLHAKWQDRLEFAQRRTVESTLQLEATNLIFAEMRQRAAILEARSVWVAIEVWPAYHASAASALGTCARHDVRRLQHALYVAQKESVLIKQRATALMEQEMLGCRRVLDRLHIRRTEDLRWLPADVFDSHTSTGTRLDAKGCAVMAMPLLLAVNAVEDLEHASRIVLARAALDSLHTLHMCLLIS